MLSKLILDVNPRSDYTEWTEAIPLGECLLYPFRPEVIQLDFILKLKIKRNDWLLDVSASSQSLRFILSLRLYSSFIISGPGDSCNVGCSFPSVHRHITETSEWV